MKKRFYIAALFATAAGVATAASAQTSCTVSTCTCFFPWNASPMGECKNGSFSTATIFADLCFGKTDTAPSPDVYYSQVRLLKGISASNIPRAQNGTLFPEACRATDSNKSDAAVGFRSCPVTSTSLIPFQQRVLVGK